MTAIVPIIVMVVILAVVLVVSWRLSALAYQATRISLMLLLAVLASTLAAQLPGQGWGEKALRNVDVIFLVDTTYSMNALDGRDGTSRLANVREDIKKTTASVNGSAAIINVGESPYVYLPLTDDQTDINLAADSLITPGAYNNRSGSHFAAGFDAASIYIADSLQLNPDRKKILVFMSDGERRGDDDTVPGIQRSLARIKPQLASALVIGYGQPETTSLPVVDLDVSNGTLKQYDFSIIDPDSKQLAGTKRDDSFLAQTAGQLGGTYVKAENQQAIETEIITRLTASLTRESGRLVETSRQANLLYLLPIAVALGLLIAVEIIGIRVPLLTEQDPKR